ncbi:MAG: rhomboid family intramembrane serine protease [Candidatus Omnitrophota bacterium]
MIPLRDSTPSRHFPVVTLCFIILNLYVFIKGIFLGPSIAGVIHRFAVIPVNYSQLSWRHPDDLFGKSIPLLSALFLHGGWLHLIGNMWYLWIFGDNVEDRLGHFRFFIFYIVCGICGNLAHIAMNIHSNIPAIGASGCIAGVLGAYFLMFPRAKILTLLPIFVVWTVVEIRAFFFLGVWFIIQFLSGFLLASSSKEVQSIAWWAHIGGFIAGIILTVLFTSGKKRKKR